MKFYTKQHKYYCGIDLHTKSMYICILNQQRKIIVHKNLKTDSRSLYNIISPFLPDIAISYARLIKPQRESASKKKIGNAYLKWALHTLS